MRRQFSRTAPLVFALALAAGAALPAQQAPVDRSARRLDVSPPQGWSLAAGLRFGGTATSPLAVSPDGRFLAILARDASGRNELWVRAFDTSVARGLPGTDDAVGPFWSPDSQSLGFFVDGTLKTVALSGGLPVTLCATASFNSASWGRDGVIIFAEGPGNAAPSPIRRVSASGGVSSHATAMVAGDPRGNHISPVFLPDGRHFLYRLNTGALYATSLDSTNRTLVMNDVGNVVYAGGHLLFLRGSTLMAQRFDPERLALTGEPMAIAEQVLTAGVGVFSASETVLAYQAAPPGGGSRIMWVRRDGSQRAAIGKPSAYTDLALSHDGMRAVINIAGAAGSSESGLWNVGVDGGPNNRVRLGAVDGRAPVWSPDGKRVIFHARRGGVQDLYEKASDGAGTEQRLFADAVDKTPSSVSPDGQFLLFESRSQQTRADLWLFPLEGNRTPRPYLVTSFNEQKGQFSPDGRWIAYQSTDESGSNEVYVAPFPGPGNRRKISTAGGTEPTWRRDGGELYFVDPRDRLMAAPVDSGGARFDAGTAQPLFVIRRGGTGNVYGASPDGQRFLVNMAEEHTSPATVVVNWAAALKP